MSGPTRGTDGAAHAHGSLHNPDVAHESSDINVRGVIWFIVTLVVVTATVQVAMWVMFRVLNRMEVRNDADVTPLAVPAGQLPPEPRLQTTPWQDLKVFRADEDKTLATYGWVDRKSGVARMPIDKAKDLLLQRGLPARADGTDPTAGTYVAAGGEANSGRSLPAGQPDTSTPAPAKPAPAATTQPQGAPKKNGGGL
jgi:hypothetical protein